MTDTSFLTKVSTGFNRNAPTILTITGVSALIAAGVLGCKATPKAIALKEAAEEELLSDQLDGEDTEKKEMTKFELVKTMAPAYLPAIALGFTGTLLIFAANHINLKRVAAVAGVYSVTANNFKEYKAKVEEMVGSKKAEQIKQNIVSDYVQEHPPVESKIVETGHGKTLFLDKFSGQYFYSDADFITHVENLLNQGLMQNGSVPLSEYYRLMGFANTPSIADYVGWDYNIDGEIVQLEKVSHYCEEKGYHITAISPNINLRDFYKTWY